jgi:hypothetical protein
MKKSTEKGIYIGTAIITITIGLLRKFLWGFDFMDSIELFIFGFIAIFALIFWAKKSEK